MDARELAERLDGEQAVEVALFREDDEAVARRDGEELRFARDGDGFRTSGDERSSTTRTGSSAPGPRSRTRTPASCSSRPSAGVEFADLGGRHHAGGGSHGSLVAGDSVVPMLTVGLDAPPRQHHRTSRRSCSRTSGSSRRRTRGRCPHAA